MIDNLAVVRVPERCDVVCPALAYCYNIPYGRREVPCVSKY